jgi:hypothetical protein
MHPDLAKLDPLDTRHQCPLFVRGEEFSAVNKPVRQHDRRGE